MRSMILLKDRINLSDGVRTKQETSVSLEERRLIDAIPTLGLVLTACKT